MRLVLDQRHVRDLQVHARFATVDDRHRANHGAASGADQVRVRRAAVEARVRGGGQRAEQAVVGGHELVDVSLRDAIKAGEIPGPRMQVATWSLSMTGGHGDERNALDYHWCNDMVSGVADGVDEVRKAVREQVKNGADVIKMGVTGAVLVESGEVSKMVADVARRNQADVLVVGRSPAGVLGRLRMHGYSILRESPCPVLSV